MKLSVTLGSCLVALALVCGCAGLGKGPSDQELISKALADWKAAIVAKDIDKMMAVYSEQFASERGENKAAMKAFVSDAIASGYLDQAAVDIEHAVITVDKGKAIVTPVTLSGSRGAISFRLDMAKENGQWLITSTSEG